MQGIMKRIALFGALVALAVPAPALAQDSVVGGYSETDVFDPGDPGHPADPGNPADPGDPAATGSGTGSGTASADDGTSLPFTGLDVGLLAIAGTALVAVGVGTRRLTRRPDTA